MTTTDRNVTGARSNWGRWGPDDQRGALNLITEERVLRALRRPTAGRTYALGTTVGRNGPVSGPRNPTWHVTTQVHNPDDRGRGRAEDMLVMHTHAHSHLDSLAHVWVDGLLYNGASAERSVTRVGTRHASVDGIGSIVGTAVILDVTLDGPFEPGEAISADHLDAAAGRLPVPVEEADVLLVRTGWMDIFAADPERFAHGEPGFDADGAEWLADQDPAAIGIDNFGFEVIPAGKGANPLLCHELFLRDLGVHLLESLDLSAPAAAGATVGLFVAAPLLIDRGLGSPVNPLLVV